MGTKMERAIFKLINSTITVSYHNKFRLAASNFLKINSATLIHYLSNTFPKVKLNIARLQAKYIHFQRSTDLPSMLAGFLFNKHNPFEFTAMGKLEQHFPLAAKA